ncbi:MAG: HAD family phosphatase [Deltaproteobacteria bacterium]|nr:HAD family phosphatase [Deltaproteobacteria bacterium]
MHHQAHPSIAPIELLARIEQSTHLFFDVDRTLVQNQGVIPERLLALLQNCDKACGIATSRCRSEAEEIVSGTGHALRGLFSGPIVLEDGALAILPGSERTQLLIPVEAHMPVMSLATALVRKLERVDGEATWRRFPSLEAPLVQMPEGYEASSTIWEKGPAGCPDFAHVMALVRGQAEALGVSEAVQLLEIGDGTLRITVPGISKGSALQQLHEEGVLDLEKVVYFGDGHNDIPAAHVVRKGGGTVVAVDHHCQELMQLASHVTPLGLTGPSAVTAILASYLATQP